jgi:hypothetical protein
MKKLTLIAIINLFIFSSLLYNGCKTEKNAKDYDTIAYYRVDLDYYPYEDSIQVLQYQENNKIFRVIPKKSGVFEKDKLYTIEKNLLSFFDENHTYSFNAQNFEKNYVDMMQNETFDSKFESMFNTEKDIYSFDYGVSVIGKEKYYIQYFRNPKQKQEEFWYTLDSNAHVVGISRILNGSYEFYYTKDFIKKINVNHEMDLMDYLKRKKKLPIKSIEEVKDLKTITYIDTNKTSENFNFFRQLKAYGKEKINKIVNKLEPFLKLKNNQLDMANEWFIINVYDNNFFIYKPCSYQPTHITIENNKIIRYYDDAIEVDLIDNIKKEGDSYELDIVCDEEKSSTNKGKLYLKKIDPDLNIYYWKYDYEYYTRKFLAIPKNNLNKINLIVQKCDDQIIEYDFGKVDYDKYLEH